MTVRRPVLTGASVRGTGGRAGSILVGERTRTIGGGKSATGVSAPASTQRSDGHERPGTAARRCSRITSTTIHALGCGRRRDPSRARRRPSRMSGARDTGASGGRSRWQCDDARRDRSRIASGRRSDRSSPKPGSSRYRPTVRRRSVALSGALAKNGTKDPRRRTTRRARDVGRRCDRSRVADGCIDSRAKELPVSARAGDRRCVSASATEAPAR